jgi:hypothetical protein
LQILLIVSEVEANTEIIVMQLQSCKNLAVTGKLHTLAAAGKAALWLGHLHSCRSLSLLLATQHLNQKLGSYTWPISEMNWL